MQKNKIFKKGYYSQFISSGRLGRIKKEEQLEKGREKKKGKNKIQATV